MRIVVHDFGGYSFSVQLARKFAGRGHDVLYLYAAAFNTPRGRVARQVDDPQGLALEGIDLGQQFHRRASVQRLTQERRYGAILRQRVSAFAPSVIISANCPLDAQAIAQSSAHESDAAFIFWQQDLYAEAVARLLGRRMMFAGRIIGARFAHLEKRLLRDSDAIVSISADFLPVLRRWRVREDRVTIIKNWAPLDEIRPLPKVNAWSTRHGFAGGAVVLYAGTLGRKHNLELLLSLAEGLPHATVVVVSEGAGTDRLREVAGERRNLVLLPLQPVSELSEVLATGDVLVAVLDEAASSFSVPSKILSYLAAGRPIVAAIPSGNLAAQTINEAGAGVTVDPSDPNGFVAAADTLLLDHARRLAAGAAARQYAQRTFDIDTIADRFESVIHEAVDRSRARFAFASDTASQSQESTGDRI